MIYMAWHLLKQGNEHLANYMEFLIDTAADINTPPAEYNYAPSSIAHTPGFKEVYEADADQNWVKIGE